MAENYSDAMYDESHSEADSSSTNESYYEVRNRWHSAEDIRKVSLILTSPKTYYPFIHINLQN